MFLRRKARNVWRAVLQAYGTKAVKRSLWNGEFTEGRWNCLDRTSGDFVYAHVEQYARGGSILDLGCGSGSTGNELDAASYRTYVGVDISDVAIEKAATRTAENRRADKNTYIQSDIFSYVPNQRFDVILFRDSIYYIPRRQIAAMLHRYSRYLCADGVFIVRMFDTRGKYQVILDTIESHFTVVERRVSNHSNALVIVFRSSLIAH